MAFQQGGAAPPNLEPQISSKNPSLPRAGHVSQLRNNWRIFEDEALALRMQHEEISDHYAGNRVRNQQIRSDLPQAKEIQHQEVEAADREREKQQLQLNTQALADERIALELALRQRGFLDDDDDYSRRKDQMMARNLEDLEKRYRQRGNTDEPSASIKYNDQEYKVQMAKPAVVTDEPLYANYQEERFMNEVPLNSDFRSSSREGCGPVGISRADQKPSGVTSINSHISEDNNFKTRKPVVSQPMGQIEISSSKIDHSKPEISLSHVSPRNAISPTLRNHSREASLIELMADVPNVPNRNQESLLMPSHSRETSRSSLSPRGGSKLAEDETASVQFGSNFTSSQGPSYSMAGLPPALPAKNRNLGNSDAHAPRRSNAEHPADLQPAHGSTSGQRPSSRGSRPANSSGPNRVPPLAEDLNTSSDYLTSRTSSRASHRSDSSLTSYSEQGAVGYLPGFGPVYGACGVSKPGEKLDDRWKYDSRSSNDFDPMDSVTPRQRGDRRMHGDDRLQLSGAVSLPVDELSLRSALSPEEIRAAEAAEQLLEQERRDAELALRLQNELETGVAPHGDVDRKLAQEAQDREFARVLQAKEKARLRRAKEKARQKKLERQRQQESAQDPDSIQYLPDDEDERTSPRDDTTNRQDVTESEQRIYESRTESSRGHHQDRSQSRISQAEPSSRHDRSHSRTSQVEGAAAAPRGTSQVSPRDTRLSPLPEPDPPARRPYVHTQAIDSHMNDTYCKTQITPTMSNSSTSSGAASSETSEPQYENLDKQGKPLKTEPILHLPSSKKSDKISPRQTALNENMPVPPYMPMQSCATRKSESLERKINKKKEKEGCKQQ